MYPPAYEHHRKNISNEFWRPKTYKYVKILKSNFFMITIFSLHIICSESKKVKFLDNNVELKA